MQELIEKVTSWAEEKGIYDSSTPIAQLKITAEEVVEAVEAISALNELKRLQLHSDQDIEKAEMEVGDILVTLINACYLAGFDLEECLKLALDKISKRTGEMKNGKFVKDE
jgi:NTP pyrophosphatase (non-canonical NTP hydrolase)